MAITDTKTAADQYAVRVDAVLAQPTRLRGPQPRATSSRDSLPTIRY